MKPKKRERFAPKGVLAILPSAHGETFATQLNENPGDISDLVEIQAERARPGNSYLLGIQGPLDHHPGGWFDSYDMIVCRVAEAACEEAVENIILVIDSPGGMVSGCFDASRRIREICQQRGKKLIAFVDGMACSAAYSLACAADEIVVGQTSMVGSIGVIDCMVDVTGNDQINGLKFAVITSGARKADGNPHTPISTEALAIAQSRVDDLAQIFFSWVSERRALSVESVQGLQAGISYGEKAVSLRLADSVSTLDQLVERLLAPIEQDSENMKMSYKDAKKALESVAADKAASDDDKAQAKKMLAAIADDDDDKKDDDKAEESDDKKKDDDKKDAKKAEESDDKKKDDDKKDDKATAAAVARVEARLDAAERAGKVKSLLATRPDLTEAQVKAFKQLEPTALVSILLATPTNKTAETAPTPMRAALAGVKGEEKPTEAKPTVAYDAKRAEQRRRMGLAEAPKASIRKEGSTTFYDLATPTEGQV